MTDFIERCKLILKKIQKTFDSPSGKLIPAGGGRPPGRGDVEQFFDLVSQKGFPPFFKIE